MVETTTQGRVKCNIDAAIFESEKCFGAGFCLRDDLGQFLIAKTAYQHGVPKPAVAAMSFIKFLLFPKSEVHVVVTAKKPNSTPPPLKVINPSSIDAVATPVTPKPRVVLERNGSVSSR
ncbi:hypothetical protein JHK85_047917 [Glycine max]|nr:hypothetical protein JHK85_047917 [Glycine max]